MNNGGPAFPSPAGVAHITEQGMTLRDYFAAKAMQGALACDVDDPQTAALYAYQVADAMLKVRNISD